MESLEEQPRRGRGEGKEGRAWGRDRGGQRRARLGCGVGRWVGLQRWEGDGARRERENILRSSAEVVCAMWDRLE